MEEITPDERSLIDAILRRRAAAKEPAIPAEKVKRFIAQVGTTIDRTGGLSREQVEQLLQQLKNGEL